VDVGKLVRYARVCRVEGVMRPYLEALLWLEMQPPQFANTC
jgi:hypothetical protein